MKTIKCLFGLLMFICLVSGPLPTRAFAANETVSNAKSIGFRSTTTQASIDTAWGAGAATITANANGSYTVTLLKNISLGSTQDIQFGNFEAGSGQPELILDLNGCTITGTSIPISNLGNLTIRDNSSDKSGAVVYSGTGYFVAVNNVGYEMTIEGGTFTCVGAGSYSSNAAINSAGTTTTIINGGTFNGGEAGAVISYGNTIINGGTISGKYGVVSKINGDGDVGNITFPETSTAVVTAASMAFLTVATNGSGGTFSAAGGTFNAPSLIGRAGEVDLVSVFTATGGTYNVDPSKSPANYIPSGGALAIFPTEIAGRTTYTVGANNIAQKAASVAPGEEIEILSGAVVLNNMPEGVIVKNSGTRQIVVNGAPVSAGDQIEVGADPINVVPDMDNMEVDVPKTGDTNNPFLWIALLLLSVCALVGISI